MTTSPRDPADRTPTSNPVLRRALNWGAAIAGGIAVVGGIFGLVFAGTEGLVSALLGTLLAVVFMGITGASILLANRFAGSDVFVGAFFGIVLGGWLLKFIVFIVLVVLLRGVDWLDPVVLFLAIVAGVIGSLVVDVLVVARSRLPYASDAQLPPPPSDD
ncbi:hypothetical protein GCM10017608_28940 [Agromyces luteolus]|uniref:Uncharacterized protein n=1 Tax=Agromyces luteolus TaxID=88373 RepID=A0A7C9HJA6_9MICO|nr:hypothetical protein [Agromyces luteolus]MUN06462.1 hypothetical protein [Agromyces luteolus]GLK28959.1 hypothetical protein GCM10017608_28940 [Agromyces luteolus]